MEVFIQFAKEAATVVAKKSDALDQISKGKVRKSGVDKEGDGGPAVKKRRGERMEDAKASEIADENGLEKSYSSKYFGRADVKLNKLSLSMKISIPINEIKVLGILN